MTKPQTRTRTAAARLWHHLPDGTFRNPPGSPLRSMPLRAYGPYVLRMLAKSMERVEVPPGHVLPEREALAQLAAAVAHGPDSLTWLGHASFLIRTGGKTIITDPYLTEIAGPQRLGPRRYVRPGITIENLPPIDVLLISHNHYDHLDEKTLAALPGRKRMQVIAPLRLGAFFRARGFRHVVELDWHDSVVLDTLRVSALPVVHWSRRSSFDTNRTLWTGFGLRSATQHIFFGGDSAYGAVFREIGESYGPFDLALIGIGAYEPRELMHASHATPEEGVQIGVDIGARRIVGMHWGTVVLTEEPQFEAPERFRAAGRARGIADEDLWIMRIGETRSLPPGAAVSWPANR